MSDDQSGRLLTFCLLITLIPVQIGAMIMMGERGAIDWIILGGLLFLGFIHISEQPDQK